MTSRTSVVLLLGFGTLLLLIALLGVGAMRRTNRMYQQMIAAQEVYDETDRVVRGLPADIYLAGLVVRDYILDPSPSAAPGYKDQLAKEQQAIERHLARLGALTTVQRETVERLQRQIQAYVDSLDPMLRWSPEEKVARSYRFIQDNLIRRRQTIVALAQELSTLNSQSLSIQRQAAHRRHAALQRFVLNLLTVCLCLGVAVATMTAVRVVSLENKTRSARERAEEAEREQRRLAMCVVQAQEDERKRISLELHDAVGQMASALGMELGRLESLHSASGAQFHEKLDEVKRLNGEVVRAVKELATGLRPAMLDVLGLGPALRSHAREFSRRTGIPVAVRLDGELNTVPEPHRTCIYRIVQEALNNCALHAGATNANVSLYGRHDLVSLTVQDNGMGFDAARLTKTGLGLVGIQERVRDLNGKVNITSKPGHGTLVQVELPVTEASAA
jgi:signal transduction histidine kinase